MLKQYEEASKDFVALVREHHDASPAFSFTGVAGDDYVYSYVTPIRGFADIDAVNAGFNQLAARMRWVPRGPPSSSATFAITRRFETHGGWLRPDLSLEPVKTAQGKQEKAPPPAAGSRRRSEWSFDCQRTWSHRSKELFQTQKTFCADLGPFTLRRPLEAAR